MITKFDKNYCWKNLDTASLSLPIKISYKYTTIVGLRIRECGTIPCFALGAQITHHPAPYF